MTLTLRSEPLMKLSEEAVEEMLRKKDFYDHIKNKKGQGLLHEYQPKVINEDKIVIDHATNLIWQQSGSHDMIPYANMQEYIVDLNQNTFAGFNNWRLPTLEEAMLLVEAQKNKDNRLHINPLFDAHQEEIWTADYYSASVAWCVDFRDGYCVDSVIINLDYCIRAVRSAR